ncbi:MAG: hypothetical protein HYX93_07475 [Chloroflexi bacterium]|nr:hypothetical protein [Chloroflexota bacterium]
METLPPRPPIVPWAFFASNLYHNSYWLRFIGNRRVKAAMRTGWGQLSSGTNLGNTNSPKATLPRRQAQGNLRHHLKHFLS